jgi:hypothetical protein
MSAPHARIEETQRSLVVRGERNDVVAVVRRQREAFLTPLRLRSLDSLESATQICKP